MHGCPLTRDLMSSEYFIGRADALRIEKKKVRELQASREKAQLSGRANICPMLKYMAGLLEMAGTPYAPGNVVDASMNYLKSCEARRESYKARACKRHSDKLCAVSNPKIKTERMGTPNIFLPRPLDNIILLPTYTEEQRKLADSGILPPPIYRGEKKR